MPWFYIKQVIYSGASINTQRDLKHNYSTAKQITLQLPSESLISLLVHIGDILHYL